MISFHFDIRLIQIGLFFEEEGVPIKGPPQTHIQQDL
jgi:hypothetical protein